MEDKESGEQEKLGVEQERNNVRNSQEETLNSSIISYSITVEQEEQKSKTGVKQNEAKQKISIPPLKEIENRRKLNSTKEKSEDKKNVTKRSNPEQQANYSVQLDQMKKTKASDSMKNNTKQLHQKEKIKEGSSRFSEERGRNNREEEKRGRTREISEDSRVSKKRSLSERRSEKLEKEEMKLIKSGGKASKTKERIRSRSVDCNFGISLKELKKEFKELNITQTNSSKNQTVRSTAIHSRRSSGSESTNKVEGEVTKKRKLDQQEKGNVKRVKCYRCEGYGHFQDECTSIIVDKGSKSCYKCSGKGHIAKDCPNLKRDICYVCGLKGHHGLDCPSQVRALSGRGYTPPPNPLPILVSHSFNYPLNSPEYNFSSNIIESNNWPMDNFIENSGGNYSIGSSYIRNIMHSPTHHPNFSSNVNNAPSRTFQSNSCYRCGEIGHNAKQCDKMANSDACFRCGKVGHIARECENPVDPSIQLTAHRVCFRCGEEGHFARDCTKSGATPSRDSCFRCGKPGHLSRDCTGEDIRVCFICKKRGHVARECPSGSSRHSSPQHQTQFYSPLNPSPPSHYLPPPLSYPFYSFQPPPSLQFQEYLNPSFGFFQQKPSS